MNLVTLCGSGFYPLYEELVQLKPDLDIRTLPNIPAVIRTAERCRPDSAVLLIGADLAAGGLLAEQLGILKSICPNTRCYAAGGNIGAAQLPDGVIYIGKTVGLSEFLMLTEDVSETLPAKIAHTPEPAYALESTVTEIIRKIGIPANVKGYRYLRCAIILATNDMTVMDNVMTLLYPTVAMSNNTTPGRVERAIRHAITIAWSRADGDVEDIERRLHFKIDYSHVRPSNSEFIALISDCLRLGQCR
ncbi:MAG: sporulation initiation factor Spo0A C-terminal domain-containing protein [Ruminococcus sp.]|nr:sporulation initiation factor Spo0A C-terminal domain-containing protein [Ruminococcus sp.]